MTTSPSVTTPITAIGAGIFAINTLIEPSASAAHDIDWLEANHEQVKTDLAILRDLLNGNHSASAIRLPSGSWLAVITDDDHRAHRETRESMRTTLLTLRTFVGIGLRPTAARIPFLPSRW